ncbi:nSTAND1 domain-containing NTPase [Ulvibacter antarcticus]|uniref:Novel STAND NTPase 1 domain-containing protein n=1 Tax=Ulvibacter antarcticus TaxID=442714 RepID=A0A3L9YX54_9FLAO|nr:hypothetical protein [Ulvibacter antarcticus]RMA64390.1 hypothetical protein BXY75_1265 [Ulvibacter antarcticus]
MSEYSLYPYVGLRPFNTDESILFFGRNNQILELLQRLHQYHFVAVVGGSGSGKSSLIRAGLIPSLKAGYLVQDSDHWQIAIMKPGRKPVWNLAKAFFDQTNELPDINKVDELARRIEEEGVSIILSLLSEIDTNKNTNFFLLIDQFEELFRFGMEHNDAAKIDEAIDFVNIILELSEQNRIPIYVVTTMRSDFIGDCAQFHGLPEAMNRSQYLVPHMTRKQLKYVIEAPAKLFGRKVNPSLTNRLLNDLGKVKDELPLLEHALMRIWEHEIKNDNNGELDLADYEQIGGIKKALSIHADEALIGMTDNELELTKKIFQSLSTTDENGRKIRRPALLSQLVELTNGSTEEVLKIVNLFIGNQRSFLNQSKAGEDIIIDISHESLIRQWNTLGKWVDKEAEAASHYLQLSDATRLHSEGKKDYLTGSELQTAQGWYDNFKPIPAWGNRYIQGFDNCILYLKKSNEEQLKIEVAERDRKKKKRFTIALIMIMLGIMAIGSITALFLINKSKNEVLFAQQRANNWIIKNIWKSAIEAEVPLDYTTGIRGLAEKHATLLNMDKFKFMSNPLEVFLSGPHEKGIRYYENDFARYNPEIVEWISNNMIPDGTDAEFQQLTQRVYNKHLKILAEAYIRSYVLLKKDSLFVEKQKAAYLEHLESGNPYNFFRNKQYRYYFNTMDKIKPGAFPYYSKEAAGFWIRRNIDGTADEFYDLLIKLAITYDPNLATLPNELKYSFRNAMGYVFPGTWHVRSQFDSVPNQFIKFDDSNKTFTKYQGNLAKSFPWKFINARQIKINNETIDYIVIDDSMILCSAQMFGEDLELKKLYPLMKTALNDTSGSSFDILNATLINLNLSTYYIMDSPGKWSYKWVEQEKEYSVDLKDMGRTHERIYLLNQNENSVHIIDVEKNQITVVANDVTKTSTYENMYVTNGDLMKKSTN